MKKVGKWKKFYEKPQIPSHNASSHVVVEKESLILKYVKYILVKLSLTLVLWKKLVKNLIWIRIVFKIKHKFSLLIFNIF